MERVNEINARLTQIQGEVEQRGEKISDDELTAFDNEVSGLITERDGIMTRRAKLDAIAAGAGDVIGSLPVGRMDDSNGDNSGGDNSNYSEAQTTAKRYDTPQYKRAFMDLVSRGKPMPHEYRAIPAQGGVITTTDGTKAVIPTTILNEIIKKAESFGEIFPLTRRMNIQGGVTVPILDLKPKASWIGEKEVSKEQGLKATESVTFNYHSLECRMAQTLLASVVTLEEFQRLFVPLAVEAIVKAIEVAIFRGTGEGQMLGILNEPRIPDANKLTLTDKEMASWNGWQKGVFAKMRKSYRGGTFFMAQGTFDGYINGMVDTNRQPIGRVNHGIDGAETYRFGGRRVQTVEDEVLPFYDDAKDGDVIAVFMRMSDYAINTNMQMQVVRGPSKAACWPDHDNNQVKNKCILILDGKVIDPNGILLITKNTAKAVKDV